ncbi:uncharacterized protein LOC123221253 [Mangifera indica]|uniref:uncharacterized protein LOC123221253 n=1 Tax=Mangifera indica TaxID=29780 RepID=UPI001CFA3B7D|nr:uncharacterized protein LOC123221253 [Mangifera indica]
MERLKEGIEELLSFTLNSHGNQTLGSDLSLSSQFCSDLLREENNAVSVAADVDLDQDLLQGVPLYPLYKRLALALVRSVSCGAFCRTYNDGVVLVREDGLLKEREEAWSELVLNKGAELVNILNTVDSELDVQEPFFSMIKDGLKTVEGRCAIGDYNRLEPGLTILLNKCMMLQVESVRHYASFSELLEAESLVKILPGVKTVEEGMQIYRNLYAEEKEMLNGVLAICVSKLATQPYITLATILSVFKVFWVLHILLERFWMLSPHQDQLFCHHFCCHLNQITLTQGARALAKHVNRSSNKYWGIFNGSDSDKNRFAMDVIYRLIAHCCWLNVHIVQPQGIVFEIRVADGYGARWSKDGTKQKAHPLLIIYNMDHRMLQLI